MKKFNYLILSFILFLLPTKVYSLIEVDITRGNLNPLPVAVSPLSIDEKSKKSFKELLKKKNIGDEISLIVENNLKTFGGLPHRNQFVLEKSGIKYINDSKATNVESVKNSISHYDNIHLILGGLPKEGGIINLVKHMGKVKRVYLIGDAVKLFSEQLSGSIDFEISNHLEVAIRSARRNATNGDCILLAPACASFDQFKDFEERGNKFISLVEDLQN